MWLLIYCVAMETHAYEHHWPWWEQTMFIFMGISMVIGYYARVNDLRKKAGIAFSWWSI